MGLCQHCGKHFPALSSDECAKCKRILDPAVTDFNKKEIKGYPQCNGCGVVYQLMEGDMCGICKVKADPKSVLDRAFEFQGNASTERLKQPLEPNAALKKANEVRHAQTQKALQQTNKTTQYLAEGYLHWFPAGGQATLRKAQIVTPAFVVQGTELATDVFQKIKRQLRMAFDLAPAGNETEKPSLNWQEGSFGIPQGGKKIPLSLDTYAAFEGDFDTLFNELGNSRLISENDVKHKKFPVAYCTYEIHIAEDDEDGDDEGEDDAQQPTNKPQQTATPFKVPEVPKKRKAIAAPTPTPYKSAFRPDLVEYDTFRFTKLTVALDEHGRLKETVHSKNEDTIELAANWHAEISDQPNGGYIAKGFMKHCFEGRYRGMRYAILQGKTQQTSVKENEKDLKGELLLLAYGDYFAKSFGRRAEMSGKLMPDIRWNFDGAFVGTVEKYDPQSPDPVPIPLGHDTFLAVPFLVSAEERKFSGANEAGNNPNDPLGRWMDAYAHHVYDDSEGSMVLTDLQGFVYSKTKVVLFDPQAHTIPRGGMVASTGFWDKGEEGIEKFRAEHKCRTLCKELGMKPFPAKKTNGPLRIGFND